MRKFMIILATIIALLTASYFLILRSETASTGVLNFATPLSGVELEKDVAFGAHERDRIDYYYPSDAHPDKPIIVFVHGGGWNRGDKSMYKFFAEGLTSEFYNVALPNYRLYPEVTYPAFLEDNARAIAAVHKKHPDSKLVLIGHSAGAYNVLKMGVKPEFLAEQGVDACKTIQGIVALAAPTGAYPAESEPTTLIFPNNISGDEGPINHVDQPLPPILLVNGDQDSSVRFENATEMGEKMNGRAQVKIYDGADHVDPVKQFSRYFKGPIKTDVVEFIAGLPVDQGEGFCR